MSESVDDLYLGWLQSKVLLRNQPWYNYSNLINTLHNVEYIWLILGDDNRADDGVDLRFEFLRDSKIIVNSVWLKQSCSVLEMFVSFSRRANFQTDKDPCHWFWEFISNLELSHLHNDNFVMDEFLDKINTFVWRTYEYSGKGGILPLTNPQSDQREVQIWDQFFAYLEENNCE